MEEGDWQGRITWDMDSDSDRDRDRDRLMMIQNFGNVKKVVVNEELSSGQEIAADIYFEDARSIFRDMPLIAERLGAEEGAVSYNLKLLSRYLIHDPQDDSPPLLMTFYLVILLMVSQMCIRDRLMPFLNAKAVMWAVKDIHGRTVLHTTAGAGIGFKILIFQPCFVILNTIYAYEQGRTGAAASLRHKYIQSIIYLRKSWNKMIKTHIFEIMNGNFITGANPRLERHVRNEFAEKMCIRDRRWIA